MNHSFDPSMEVSLEEMLTARENRVMIQSDLIDRYQMPLISFTLNIPGPYKVFGRIPEVFEEGCQIIRDILEQKKLPLICEEILQEKTGYEAFFCVDSEAEVIKQAMAVPEEETPLGRLYDIDIIRKDGTKVSREEIGLPQRTCLLCGRPAHECSRSRRHTVDELVTRIQEMIGCPEEA